MARDEGRKIDKTHSPEDAGAHKVGLNYVFNPETGEFYPESGDLYSAIPQLHRKDVIVVDTEPTSSEIGVDCRGFKHCRFDIKVTGENVTSLKVEILRWNITAEEWFFGGLVDLLDSKSFTVKGGAVSLIEDEAFGAILFLKVREFVGDNFCLNCWAVLC